MAIYHFNAKTIGRSQGRTATAAAAYRAAARIEDIRTGQVFDYTRKRGVDGAEIITPDGSELDRSTLHQLIEQVEKRADAQLLRECEVALPRELSPEQMRECIRGFVRSQFTSAGMIADIAFHHLSGANPHAHILLTMREWKGGVFGLKRREWNDRSLCEQWRAQWAEHANAALAQAGKAARIDHRTLAEQTLAAIEEGREADAIALDRDPTLHERGSPSVAAHNAQIKANAKQRCQEWTEIELAAKARPAPGVARPETIAPRSEELTELDLAFALAMATRKDPVGRWWRFYNDEAEAVAAWLGAKAGGDRRRLLARDRAAMALAATRHERNEWLAKNPRPFWPWRWGAWRRDRAQIQAPVEKARRSATRAERLASPKAITAWRLSFADRQAELKAALAKRRTIAATPSEQHREQQQRNDLRRQWERPRAPLMPSPPGLGQSRAGALNSRISGGRQRPR